MAGSRPVTYGEFPELFSGFPPEAPVDLDDRDTLRKLRIFGDRDVVERIVTDERRRMLDAPLYTMEAESRVLLRRLQETGQADPDMDGSEDPV